MLLLNTANFNLFKMGVQYQFFPILMVQMLFPQIQQAPGPGFQKGRKIPGSVQNMKPVRNCTGFIFCAFSTLVSFKSFRASDNFCRLLITFANSLDPDQDRHTVCPDLDLSHLTLIVFLKEYFENVDFEKNQQKTTEA